MSDQNHKEAVKYTRSRADFKGKKFPLFNFFFPPSEKAKVVALLKRGQSLGVRYGSIAYVLRQGGKEFVQRQNQMLDKVEAGEFHAKKRTTIK